MAARVHFTPHAGYDAVVLRTDVQVGGTDNSSTSWRPQAHGSGRLRRRCASRCQFWWAPTATTNVQITATPSASTSRPKCSSARSCSSRTRPCQLFRSRPRWTPDRIRRPVRRLGCRTGHPRDSRCSGLGDRVIFYDDAAATRQPIILPPSFSARIATDMPDYAMARRDHRGLAWWPRTCAQQGQERRLIVRAACGLGRQGRR